MQFTNPLVQRLVVSCVIGLLLSWGISEGAYYMLSGKDARAPQSIEIIIPAGTAAQQEARQVVSVIPQDMVFVTGDALIIRNEDVTNHQLGPLTIPSGEIGTLKLEQADKFLYGCSFQPSRYLGFDVRPPGATLQSRLLALAFAGPPTITLIAIYSLLALPLCHQKQTPPSAPAVTSISNTDGALSHSTNGKAVG